MTTNGKTWEPRIVGFLCNWCAYRGADLAGTARTHYAPNLLSIRVMCSGRIEPTLVLKALEQGADGVLVAGCHFGDCHYAEGNYKAMRRMNLLLRMLKQLGLDDGRVRLEWVSAGEGERFASMVNEMVEHIRSLGPLRWPGNWNEDSGRLEALEKLATEHTEAMEVLA